MARHSKFMIMVDDKEFVANFEQKKWLFSFFLFLCKTNIDASGLLVETDTETKQKIKSETDTKLS